MSTKRINAEQFVELYMEVYNKGGTYVDLAKRTSMPISRVYARAHFYKNSAIILPKLTRKYGSGTQRRLNTGFLNSLIKRLTR